MAIAGRVAIVPKGDWVSDVAYERLDYVKYKGNSYVAKKASVGVIPSEDNTSWMLSTSGGTDSADLVSYNNSTSGLSATDVQAAIDELASEPNVPEGVTYISDSAIDTVELIPLDADTLGGYAPGYFASKQSVDNIVDGTTSLENAVLTGIPTAPTASIEENTTQIATTAFVQRTMCNFFYHNVPRLAPKDITSYYQDGSLWDRLEGRNGYTLFEDIYVGDYFQMSRPISAYNQNQNYQLAGSDWITIAGISTLLGNGDTGISYEHLVMVPGKGFGGTQHFGRSRMNPTNTTEGGYVGSEMYTTTIGAVVTEGSTATTATINQQLYAEFGSHLKTTRELLSNSLNSTGYNRFGEAGGCSNKWGWYDCQAVLMSEIEVYGSIVWSSSGYDTGTAKMQLPLFANNKQAMNNRSSWYWLKDVASASYFCRCDDFGHASYGSAGSVGDFVRPRFVIAA